ncbi:hypothetical protein MalM14_14950 [Gimesia chilikensis]|nr:hypothetical protein MalM14_14950 [Gimesia chilikensis]
MIQQLIQYRIRVIFFLVLVILTLSVFWLYSLTLSKTAFASGILLLCCILFLAAYQWRKKLSFLSLGTATVWLQFHIFVGLMSSLLFLMHIGFRVPDGMLEFALFLTYCFVFLSGVLGWLLSRIIPYRLLSRGEQVIYERIPIYYRKVREAVEQLVSENLKTDEENAIADFYQKNLREFFSGPRNQLRHILHSRRHRHQLMQQVSQMLPYLEEREQEAMKQIAVQIQLKDDLDYQRSLQSVLKTWLFVHVPLTWTLILFALFHTITVCAFASTSG